MPYFGQDWRSPGDEWVRTKEGWEQLKLWRVKVLENLNSHCLSRLLRMALEERDSFYYDKLLNVHKPYMRYIRATSREQKMLTSISEAFIHLDMSTAGKDLRRINYVCKLLKLLLNDKLAFLSGAAQKHVFSILEEIVTYAVNCQHNVQEMQCLVSLAGQALNENHWDHIGSSHLWNSHYIAINGMATKLKQFQVSERKDDGKLTFCGLPEVCKQQILSRIPDHVDILHLSQTNICNYNITGQQLLWKQLCFYHFTKHQILTFANENEEESMTDWKCIYRRCYQRFGKKDVYADTLAICRHCNNIFWQSLGHPCGSDLPPACKSLTPEEFVGLFQF